MDTLTEEQTKSFYNDIMAAKQKVLSDPLIQKENETHFQKLVWWNYLCLVVGLLTVSHWTIVPILFLSIYTTTRWTIIGHHACHGGCDTLSNTSYHRKNFAKGIVSRVIYWLDWFYPDAWSMEHNKYHHYYLNEDNDPDLLENTVKENRERPFLFRIMSFVMACIGWRYLYYASNTYKELYTNWYGEKRIKEPLTLNTLHTMPLKFIFMFIMQCIAPYLLFWMIGLPYIVSFISGKSFTLILYKFIAAEILTNMYTFLIIGTNHSGSDLYRFVVSHSADTPGFLIHAILGSVNYTYGNDIIDFLHGWLNYQIEHHMFPTLTPLEYQHLAPYVKDICKTYNIPYVQENVLKRFVKTSRIYLGMDRMKVYPL